MGELAQWQSHKIVRAGKVLPQQVEDTGEGTGVLTVEDVNGTPCRVVVPNNFFARGAPSPGDYVVIYDDGYKSWSPAKAFEEGYIRI
jgi:hypothetical protein